VVTDGVRAVAYSYYMVDASRVIIGSIFAGREQRGRRLEEDRARRGALALLFARPAPRG